MLMLWKEVQTTPEHAHRFFSQFLCSLLCMYCNILLSWWTVFVDAIPTTVTAQQSTLLDRIGQNHHNNM